MTGGPSGTASNGAWTNSDGALDMNGFSQTVAGLAVGGTQLASNQYIFNNASGTISTLRGKRHGHAEQRVRRCHQRQYLGNGHGGLGVTGGALNLTGVGNTYSGGTTVTGAPCRLTMPPAVRLRAPAQSTSVAAVSWLRYEHHDRFFTRGASYLTYGPGGQGNITGPVTIASGGHLAPGNSGVGTITVAQLTLQSGSQIDYDFDSINSVNDLTIVSTAGGLTLNGGVVNLYTVGTVNPFAVVGTYDLISYVTSLNGAITNLSVGDQQAGFTYTFNNDATDHLIQLVIATAVGPMTPDRARGRCSSRVRRCWDLPAAPFGQEQLSKFDST